jgi:4-amino-4-deoxy-L-arabinose transferase-like glycosyltransferase
MPFDGASARASRPAAPAIWIAASILGFVAIWTLFHAVAHGARAVNDDTAEAYVWGQQFEWGYWKHPPFWAWIAGVWFDIFPRNVWPLALLASANAAIGLLGAWKLIGCFLRGDDRVSATFLLVLTPLYTFLSFTYNANSIFIPLWPWTAYFFVRAIDRQSVAASILFGVLAAIDMLSKYYATILIVTCVCAALVHPARKAYLRSALPWLSAGTALALFTPHILWLMRSNYPTFHYFGHETGHGAGFVFVQAAALLGEGIAYNIVAAIFVMIVTQTSPSDWLARFRMRAHDSRFRFLAVLTLLPAFLTLACAVLFRVGISNNTLIGVFCLMPALFIELAAPENPAKLQRASIFAAGLVAFISLAAAPVFAKIGTRDFAATRALAQQLDSLWARNARTPLQYVSGAEPYAEKMAFYLPERPRDFILYKFEDAPWVTPAGLARSGFAAVCDRQDNVCIAHAHQFAPGKVIAQPFTLASHRQGDKAGKSLMLFVAPPREAHPS